MTRYLIIKDTVHYSQEFLNSLGFSGLPTSSRRNVKSWHFYHAIKKLVTPPQHV